MKKVLFLLTAVLCMATVFAMPKKKKKTVKATTEAATPAVAATPAAAPQEQTGEKKTPLAFKEMKHSFGKVKQGTPVSYEFGFKNVTGDKVIIESATAQCGCTTPEYPKAPVMKGSSDKIKVTYNAASVGNFTKQVTVRVAGTPDPIVLTIDGEVLANEAPKKDN